jgi:hypothetical protein
MGSTEPRLTFKNILLFSTFALYFMSVSWINPGPSPEPGSGTCRLIPIRFSINDITEEINCSSKTIFFCYFNVENVCNLFNIQPLTGTSADRFKSVLWVNPGSGPESGSKIIFSCYFNADNVCQHFSVQSLTGTSADRFKFVPWANPGSGPEPGSKTTFP